MGIYKYIVSEEFHTGKSRIYLVYTTKVNSAFGARWLAS